VQVIEKVCFERVLAWRLGSSGVVESSFGDTDTYAMRRFGAQIPEERKVRSGNRSSDICGCVAKTDREDLCLDWYGEKTRAERQDTSTVGSGTFWEDSNAAVGSLAEDLRDGH
jgi:hypothetical protein